MKDNFSTQSGNYAKYRPSYPAEFYSLIRSLVNQQGKALDCGTGNGQVAFQLASSFDAVYATDISAEQLKNALHKKNIVYSVQPAEETNFPDHYFDLIIVAQAIHWFDFDLFYKEVNRTLKDNGIFAAIGYGRIQISEELDQCISTFYHEVIGPFWDKERRYIDELYQTIPFPFEEIKTSGIEYSLQWDFEHLIGYLETWSAVKHFTKEKGYNPVEKLRPLLQKEWGADTSRKVHFPFLMRIGKKI